MMLNRVSLNTIGLNRIGLNRIGKPSRASSERPYIDPEVLASLKAVCICYGKSNDDPDRAVVKNLVDPDNPFVISNAAFKLNSGFGKYEDDFTNWVAETGTKLTSDKITNSNPTKNWIAYRSSGVEFKEMRIRILGIPDNGVLYFQRPAADGGPIRMFNGDNNIPAFTSTGICGFFINNLTGLGWSNLVIEQIPSFEGAFVTDGIDDLITSTKTVQEMGITEACTVISMIHHIDVPSDASFNNIRNSAAVSGRNGVYASGTTGIYGWSKEKVSGTSTTLINNILGDKNNYTNGGGGSAQVGNMKFSVQGFISDSGVISETSSVAWYWTIIANKVLTTDQINQVIAYYNLDKTLSPDILCDVTRQGITNDNHVEFNDKLIDYSGNGRDIQMNNLAWKGGSGIAAKLYETFKDWGTIIKEGSPITEIDEFTRIVESNDNSYWVNRIRRTSDFDKVYSPIKVYLYQDENRLVHECKYTLNGESGSTSIYETFEKGYIQFEIYTKDKFTNLPEGAEVNTITEWFYPKSNRGAIKYSLIPSCKGGIILDGINDFGKVIGIPIYKDYTFIIDYERISYASSEKWVAGVVSKSHIANQGAFILMTANTEVEPGKQAYSFGGVTSFNRDDFTRALLYQSKYKCGDTDLTVGEGVDSDTLWLGTFRDNDQRFFNGAIYSLMSFPYSMNKFLIERQLKKHKLGTLYPNMVEFRPVIKTNTEWNTIEIWQGNKSLYRPAINDDKTGIYLEKNSTIGIYVKPYVGQKVSEIVYNGVPYTDLKVNSNGFYYTVVPITKSPQKINLVISSYLTMLNNETLISNETLIKNE